MADGGHTLVIPEVDGSLMESLAALARAHGLEPAEEARAILNRSLGQIAEGEDLAAKNRTFLEDAARIRAMTPPERRRMDSTAMIREARDAGYWRDY